MTPERWRQIDQLFCSALERKTEERAAFLNQACGGDAELRREVESLLAADAETTAKLIPAQIAAEMLADDQAKKIIGRRISHYRILAPLGKGGMGEVYLAQDTQLGRKIALKLLPTRFTQDAERVRRFEREARAASALNHPNIFTIHEIGQVQTEADRLHFIATEFIEGQTLRQQMKGAPMMLREALDVATQVASALNAAHTAGIIHRDIKPENIMLRPDGLVKVLDFGLAKLTEVGSRNEVADTLAQDPQANPQSTIPGTVMGTVRYMSPEQARGEKVDARSDIFSLGVVLYEMLAGQRPFEGVNMFEQVAAILDREPAPLPTQNEAVPPELQRIVSKTLCKDRAQRYQHSNDLLHDLQDLKQELQIEAKLRGKQPLETTPPVGVSAPATDDAVETRTISSAGIILSELKRHKRGVALSLAAMLVLAGGLGFWLYKLIGQNNAPTANPVLKITRLTHTGKATRAAISPDGKYVVYAIDEAGQQSLWLSQVTIASNVRIVPSAAVSYLGITFSRDGSVIYYVRNESDDPFSGVLYQAPVLGGAERKLLVNVSSPITLSPDGRRLAFVRKYPASPGGDALMVANTDGSEEKILFTRKQPNLLSPTGSAWSPDGRIIACGNQNYSGSFYSNVIGVRVADGAESPMTSQRWEDGRIGRLAWPTDGSGLIMTVPDQSGGLPQLWQLSSLKDEARQIIYDLNGYADLSLTTDSSTLAAVRTDRLLNVWVAPSDDVSRAKQITSGAERDDGASGLDWTPEGKIVYGSIAGGSPNIWIMAADGTGNKQLSVNARNNSFTSVSPDGRSIVWVANRTGINHLWRMDIDGGNPKQLTNRGGVWYIHCSPDGKWVVYGTISPEINYHSLWKVPIEGGDPVQLTEQPSWGPAVSPDGKLIACNRLDEASGQWKLALIPFEGGQPTKIFDLPGPYTRLLRWTPDGRGVAFIRTSNGVSNLWVQPLAGGEPKPLTDFKDQRIFNFAWSRDGKQLALSRGAVSSDVVLINNFK